jgi:hypothetical protein
MLPQFSKKFPGAAKVVPERLLSVYITFLLEDENIYLNLDNSSLDPTPYTKMCHKPIQNKEKT